MKKFIGIVLFLFLLSPLFGTIYYVDIATGDDSDTGLTELLAWETIAKVNTFSAGAGFNAGDIIKFNCGEEWREELLPAGLDGAPGNQITITSYSAGAKPIINGADDLTSAIYRWTAGGGGVNEYYCELSGGGDPSLTEPEQVFMDNVRLTIGTVDGLADHEWDWADSDGLGYSTVYIRDDTDDPDDSGVVIEATQRTTCITLSVDSYVDVTGMDLRYAEINLNISNGTHHTNTYDNDISYASKRGVFVTGSDNNKVYENDVSYCGVDMATKEHGIYIDDSDTIEVYLNEISYSWDAGIKLDGGSGHKAYRNYLHHNNQEQDGGMADIMLTNVDEALSNVEIYYNLIKTDSYAIRVGTDDNGYSTVAFYNNTIWGVNPTVVSAYMISFANIDILDIKNNLLHANSQYSKMMIYANNTNFTRDNNCYYAWTHGTNIGYIDAAWVTWAQLNAVETNSMNGADPLFLTDGSDFRLLMASPCVDAGVDVGLTEDYRGRSIRHAPDIGAYEDPTNAIFMAKLFKYLKERK